MKYAAKYWMAIVVFVLSIANLLLSSCSSSQRFSIYGRACPTTTTSDSKEQPAKTPSRPIEIEKIESNREISNLTQLQRKIIADAESWLGVPYLWGGNTRRGVDCSGFVKNVYSSNGIELPRTAQLQYNYSTKINDNEKVPGDLVFFSKGNRITHVGIYIGNNRIIHSSSGKGVIKQPLQDGYLQSIYVGSGRVIK